MLCLGKTPAVAGTVSEDTSRGLHAGLVESGLVECAASSAAARFPGSGPRISSGAGRARGLALVCTAPPTGPRKDNRPQGGIALLNQRNQRRDFRSSIGCPVITARPRTARPERELQRKEDQAANRAKELCRHYPVRAWQGRFDIGSQPGHGIHQPGKLASRSCAVAAGAVERAERLIDSLGKVNCPADQYVCGILAAGTVLHGDKGIHAVRMHPLRTRLPAPVDVVVETIAVAPVRFVVIELNCHGNLHAHRTDNRTIR